MPCGETTAAAAAARTPATVSCSAKSMDTRYVLVKAHLLKHSAPAVLQPAHPAQDSRGEKTEHTTHVGVLLQVVALGNLLPPDSNVDELDSYMYQTVRLGAAPPLLPCLW